MNYKSVKELYSKKAKLYELFFIDFLGIGRKFKRFFLRNNYLEDNYKILDAGCGTGILTKILYEISEKERVKGVYFNAFDFTPAMLDLFHSWIKKEGVRNVSLRQTDVLKLDQLPEDWRGYDLVVTSGMLEYIPKEKIGLILENLKGLLKNNGTMLVFMTRKNLLTKLLVENWWKANTYEKAEIEMILKKVGFSNIIFKEFSQFWFSSIMTIELKK